MADKLRTGHIPTFVKQGVFLFRFGEKEHLELVRQTGILRWGDPKSYGEPERPIPDAFTKDTLNETSKISTFIFCCSGFLGKNRQQLLDCKPWSHLECLVEVMCDKNRKIVRPWVMPILDARQFLGALQWSFTRALSNLHRYDNQNLRSWGDVTTCEHRFTCGFVNYDNKATVSEFNVKPQDKDESEFRIMGQSDISFTWNSEEQNWYPIHIPPVVLQKVTDSPVPARMLLDAVWRRDLIGRMRTECAGWSQYSGYEEPTPATLSVIAKLPENMKCSGMLK